MEDGGRGPESRVRSEARSSKACSSSTTSSVLYYCTVDLDSYSRAMIESRVWPCGVLGTSDGRLARLSIARSLSLSLSLLVHSTRMVVQESSSRRGW